MRIWLYTLCWNEEAILPYFMRHYQRFCEKIIVYDNHSTDNSETIIRSYPNTEIRKYDSNETVRDDIYIQLKNACWKEAKNKADLVIVCDMDEFLYHPKLSQFLEEKYLLYTIFKPIGYHMVSDAFPTTEGLIHQEVTDGFRAEFMDKTCLFNPTALDEILFEPGCQVSNPKGDVRYYYSNGDLKLLHYRWLGLDYAFQMDYARYQRLSEINKKNKWGSHYLPEKEALKAHIDKHKPYVERVIPHKNPTSIMDYVSNQIAISIEEGERLFADHQVSAKRTHQILSQQLTENRPYSLTYIDQSDALLLSTQQMTIDELEIQKNTLLKSGIELHKYPQAADVSQAILDSDLVCCSLPGIAPVLHWATTLDGLLQWKLLDKKKFLDIETLHAMVQDGTLFKSLWDKRVVLVGSKVMTLYSFYLNDPAYQERFPQFGLERIHIVGLVPTPPSSTVGMEQMNLLRDGVRSTYSQKPDVFLFSAGLVGKPLAVMVKEDGFTGLDIGNSLDQFMTWETSQPAAESLYQHPEFSLLWIENQLVAVKK